MGKERDFGPDLVRCMAAVLVLAVHFFLNNGFYEVPLTGAGMALSSVLRMVCMTCVPLFMMLTGYLCTERRWSAGYLKKLLPVLVVHLLTSAACLAFRILYQGESMSVSSMVRRVLDFTAVPYGWYVEMYIGLFLLTPLLAAGWRGLEEREKRPVIAALLVVTALPPLIDLRGQILPDWWAVIYPVTYFVLGARLRERPLGMRGGGLVLGWLGLSAASGLGQFFAQQLLVPGEPFLGTTATYFQSILVVGETVCLFALLIRCRGERIPRWLRWCVRRVARLALPIYLMSYITDQLIYPPLRELVSTPGKRLPFMPLMVLASLIVSGLMAQVVDWAARAVLKPLEREKARV